MALLGDEARKIPGAYKIGTGTITFVSEATAYARPDQSGYGREVYIHGGLSDKSCIYKLTTKYKIGDRVTFKYVPATRPDRGCNWAVIDLSKIDDASPTTAGNGQGSDAGSVTNDDDRKSTSSDTKQPFVYAGRSGIIFQATGKIDYNGSAFAFIQLDFPLGGRAFMADQSVTGDFTDENGVFSLLKVFPVGTPIVCDLHPQKERKGCKFFAKNVVIDYSKIGDGLVKNESKESEIRKFMHPRVPITNQQCSPGLSPIKSAVNGLKSCNEIDNTTRKFGLSTRNNEVQTEPTTESILLEKIFSDKEIFTLICTRHPDIMFSFMRSGYAPISGK